MGENRAVAGTRPRHQAGPVFLGICTAFAGCFVLFGVGLAVWQHYRLARYRPVTAVVLSTGVEEEADEDGATWAPAIRFRYEIGDRTYTSDKVFVFSESSGFPGWAQSFSDRYQAGQSTIAYCNPADPADAILVRRYSFFPYFFILLPMAMMVILLAALNRTALHMEPRRNALLASVLWHGTALLAGGHYFSVATPPYETLPLVVTGVYEWAGLTPVGLSLPRSGLLGRLRAALVLGPLFSAVGASVGLVAIPLGIAVRWGTAWFMKEPVGGARWGIYGLAIGAVAFAAIAFVAGLLGQGQLRETRQTRGSSD